MATSEQAQQGTGQHIEGMWTVDEAAKHLRVSKSWLYRQSAAGLVPVVRLGRSLRFRRADLDAWAASSKASTAG